VGQPLFVDLLDWIYWIFDLLDLLEWKSAMIMSSRNKIEMS